MVNRKVLADTPGQTDNFMRDNGWTEWNTGPGCGKEPKGTLMLDSGNSAKQTVTESTLGSTETDTKESLRIVWNMEKGCNDSLTEIFTKDFMHMESRQALGSIIGQTEATSKDHSRQDWGVAREYGRKGPATRTSMRDSTLMIKNQVTGFSHGQAGTFTKVITKMIPETGTDKCTGQMAAITKASGRMESSTEKVHYL